MMARSADVSGDRDEPPLLEARALSLRHGSRWLVRALDLQVRRGERWCLVGRNAAGKSTLLRAFAGLPMAGRQGLVLWQGREQSRWSSEGAASARAFMMQQSQDRFSISVRRLIELSVVAPGEVAPDAILAAMDVAHLIDRDAMRLSGGERQRVAIAQCVAQGAKAMLLDEPVSFQDPSHQSLVARWLASASDDDARSRRGFVIASHDVNWVARVATHVLALHGEGDWLAGPVHEVLTPDVLEQVYGCRWRAVGGALLPVD